MRTRIMLRKRDIMPPYYARLIDYATPLGLSASLEPENQVVRYVGRAQVTTTDKKGTVEKPILDGYGRIEKTSSNSTNFKIVVDCLDKSEKHIEQIYTMADLRKDMIDVAIAEVVTNHVDVVRPALNDCPICDAYGFQNLIVSECKQDPGYSFAGEQKESHADRLIRVLLKTNLLQIYPESFIRKYVRALLAAEAMRGNTGSKLLTSRDFLPTPYGQKYAERLQLPWTKDRPWTDLYQGEINCVSTWQSVLSCNIFKNFRERR